MLVSLGDLEKAFKKWHSECGEELSSSNQVALIDVETAKSKLGKDRSTLWRWEKSGYLVPVKVGGRNMYRLSDINRIMSRSSD